MGFIGSPSIGLILPPFDHTPHLKSGEYPPGVAMTSTNDPSTRFTFIRSHRSTKLLTDLLRCVTNADCRPAGKRGKHCC